MEEGGKFERTSVPMWLSIIAACIGIAGVVLLWQESSNASFSNKSIFGISLTQLIPIFILSGILPSTVANVYGIARQWNKFTLGIQVIWLMLFLLFLLFVFLIITRDHTIDIGIAVVYLVAFIIAIGRAFRDMIKR